METTQIKNDQEPKDSTDSSSISDQSKPDTTVEAPPFDLLTEGYFPTKEKKITLLLKRKKGKQMY